jgi:hypothetical protein
MACTSPMAYIRQQQHPRNTKGLCAVLAVKMLTACLVKYNIYMKI